MRGLYYDVELRILVSDSIDRIANCYDEGLIVSNYFFPMQQCQILTGSSTKENKLPAIVIINNPSRFFFFSSQVVTCLLIPTSQTQDFLSFFPLCCYEESLGFGRHFGQVIINNENNQHSS